MKRFGELLSDAIDDTMRQVFGESALKLIYKHMERGVCLKREEIGEQIQVFQVFLKKLVGLEVAQIIQGISLRRLCREIQREYSEIEAYFTFLDELYEIKFNLLALSLKEEPVVCN